MTTYVFLFQILQFLLVVGQLFAGVALWLHVALPANGHEAIVHFRLQLLPQFEAHLDNHLLANGLLLKQVLLGYLQVYLVLQH